MTRWFDSGDDEAEYDALMTEAGWLDDHVDVRTAGDRCLHLLRDAEQAQRSYGTRILDSALLQGLEAIGKKWRNRHNQAFVKEDGKPLGSMPLSRGVSRIAEDGQVLQQQVLFKVMSWEQVLNVLRRAERQREALRVTLVAVKKLLEYWEQFPDSYGPEEACTFAGTTIEAVLAEEA